MTLNIFPFRFVSASLFPSRDDENVALRVWPKFHIKQICKTTLQYSQKCQFEYSHAQELCFRFILFLFHHGFISHWSFLLCSTFSCPHQIYLNILHNILNEQFLKMQVMFFFFFISIKSVNFTPFHYCALSRCYSWHVYDFCTNF